MVWLQLQPVSETVSKQATFKCSLATTAAASATAASRVSADFQTSELQYFEQNYAESALTAIVLKMHVHARTYGRKDVAKPCCSQPRLLVTHADSTLQ